MLSDPRRLRRTVQDNFWLRLVDVQAALSGRKYGSDGEIVFELTDRFCEWNQGRYRLEAASDGARCVPTAQSADIAMTVASLASTYLGAVPFTTLARAGLAEERSPGALQRADEIFSHHLQAWSPYNW